MAMRRSNTAPQPLEYHVRPPLARAKSTIDGFAPRLHQSAATASSQYRFSASLTAASPLASPRDREDPFSLAGFFPASYLVSPEREGERWEWLRQEQPERFGDDEVQSLEDNDGSLPRTPGPVIFARAAEYDIEETIKGEDKMGVLSVLNNIDYGEDEVVDHESLYLALSKLRQVENSTAGGQEEMKWWWPVKLALHAMSSIV
ncbi:uncharacterized protein EDB91DRAFT_1110209 [Suillus paluster]|uniref:uncharacterized protein n=1 Tax=Suillus paluster TaxID=48578 RepID=UPI001B86FE56|nr:uncharacterized protein EDB91DRAFT_1110209 [Suillus paluster]KAG1749887.1 hypothetical protein EDB91DRAFT_1110209 [Suillus paluster]